jgi:hypothetical protein
MVSMTTTVTPVGITVAAVGITVAAVGTTVLFMATTVPPATTVLLMATAVPLGTSDVGSVVSLGHSLRFHHCSLASRSRVGCTHFLFLPTIHCETASLPQSRPVSRRR